MPVNANRTVARGRRCLCRLRLFALRQLQSPESETLLLRSLARFLFRRRRSFRETARTVAGGSNLGNFFCVELDSRAVARVNGTGSRETFRVDLPGHFADAALCLGMG